MREPRVVTLVADCQNAPIRITTCLPKPIAALLCQENLTDRNYSVVFSGYSSFIVWRNVSLSSSPQHVVSKCGLLDLKAFNETSGLFGRNTTYTGDPHRHLQNLMMYSDRLEEVVVSSDHDSKFLIGAGLLFARFNEFDVAEKCLLKSYELNSSHYGEEHADTLESMHYYALMGLAQHKYSEIEELFEKCYRLRVKVLGESNRDTLATMNQLGVVYAALGRVEALDIIEKCYELRCNTLGEQHEDTKTSANNLGCYYDEHPEQRHLFRFEALRENWKIGVQRAAPACCCVN